MLPLPSELLCLAKIVMNVIVIIMRHAACVGLSVNCSKSQMFMVLHWPKRLRAGSELHGEVVRPMGVAITTNIQVHKA